MIGLIGATLTVAATTLDDAVWLVPYVSSPSIPLRTRTIHAIIFVGTLVGLGVACVIAAELISQAVLLKDGNEDIVLGTAGALLCWVIAGLVYTKKMLKRRKRRLAAEAAAVGDQPGSVGAPLSSGNNYQAIGAGPADDDNGDEASSSSSDSSLAGEISKDPSVWTVISLTTLGALDEISYFPALVVGKVFTPFDLLMGTFLAACLILSIVVFLLAKCKPLIRWLDSIPLYGIVAMFATILTIGVVFDVVSGGKEDEAA